MWMRHRRHCRGPVTSGGGSLGLFRRLARRRLASLPDRQHAAGVLVFLADGWLDRLEVYNVDDQPVDEFPGPERLDVTSADTDPC